MPAPPRIDRLPCDRRRVRVPARDLCDRQSLPLVEQSLRQNRSQLMRLPQVHCAKSYLGAATIDLLRKEIGLQSAA